MGGSGPLDSKFLWTILCAAIRPNYDFKLALHQQAECVQYGERAQVLVLYLHVLHSSACWVREGQAETVFIAPFQQTSFIT